MDVISLRCLDRYRLFLEFSDGTNGVADLEPIVSTSRSAIRKLRDITLFHRAKVEDGVVAWPGGLDLATEPLYALAHGRKPPETFEDAEANELAVSLGELRRLSEIRQEDLAATLDVTQGAVSRLEGATADAKFATIRRYVTALGWDLEIVAVKGDKRLRLRGI